MLIVKNILSTKFRTPVLGATTVQETRKRLPDRQVLRLQNARNTTTFFKAITTFKQLQLRPWVRMASPAPTFWVASQSNLMD